ncbi:uncharacterized protein Polr1F isoform X2 [Drosophila montana]|uniref:uncharacterized protein Polr1F isoform X2 n=1 Tax=Drosophila montana TaxID=40370 RepID=UPI00313CCD43
MELCWASRTSRPVAGAVLHGVVRHISKHQISVIIYRVFNTTIRFTNKKQSREGIVMDQEIKFRIKDFNIANVMPFIEGELLLEETDPLNKTIKFEEDEEPEHTETHVELDALVELIKMEPSIEVDTPAPKKKAQKRKQTAEADKVVEKLKKIKKIKSEPV